MPRYGLFSRRLNGYVAFTEVADRTTHLRFNLAKPYQPNFDFGKSIDPRKDMMNVVRIETDPETGKNRVYALGRIVFSAWDLSEICPTALKVNDDEIASSSIEDEVSSSRSASPSACESGDSEENSDDGSEYFEPTEKELINQCPDDFEFVAQTFRLFLSPDRAKCRLLLKAVTADLVSAKIKRKKRVVQSLDGKIHVKKEKR